MAIIDVAGGTIRVRLDTPEARVLREMLQQLDALLETVVDDPGSVPQDPALARILPMISLDPDLDAAHRPAEHDALVADRRAAIERVRSGIDVTAPLSPTDVTAWLQTITVLRLVLAERTDSLVAERVTGDAPHDADEREQGTQAMSSWLAELQEAIVQGLSS